VSMSVEERRTEILRRTDHPVGSVRRAKASSKYDRRQRFFVVELLNPADRDGEIEEYSWCVLRDWPVSDPRSGMESQDFFDGASAVLRHLKANANNPTKSEG
jgi:hypothetical protein